MPRPLSPFVQRTVDRCIVASHFAFLGVSVIALAFMTFMYASHMTSSPFFQPLLIFPGGAGGLLILLTLSLFIARHPRRYDSLRILIIVSIIAIICSLYIPAIT
jgi:uncharacterized membrane protein